MEKTYKVYVLTDEQSRIIEVNSDRFLSNTINWIQIDEGAGNRYLHAQGNYFNLPLLDERFIYRYKLVDGVPVERTQEEMNADIEPEAPVEPSYEERISALEEQNETLIAQLAQYEESYAKGVQEA